jgi:hypothetical protein
MRDLTSRFFIKGFRINFQEKRRGIGKTWTLPVF